MKYLHYYNLFENIELSEYETLMGKLLHLYSSIPVTKEKANEVIHKIIKYDNKDFYKLGENIDLEYTHEHDKIRFVDYFDSLINSKDSRGSNFEGTICGFYNGYFATRGAKWDVYIDDKTYSVKFIDYGTKAPEISSYRQLIENLGIQDKVIDAGGLTKIFQSNDTKLKEYLWYNCISVGITGGWIIGYPKTEDNVQVIMINLLDIETMKKLLFDGNTVAPKAGYKSLFSLAISADFKKYAKVSKIKIPKLTLDDLRKLYYNSDEIKWSKEVFGVAGSKIRPDILRYIKANASDISTKLKKFDEYEK